jgi:hypothetical protein
MRSLSRFGGALLAGALCAAPTFGVFKPGLEIEDQLDVLEVDRRLISVNAASGAIVETNLEIGERVLRIESQGLVGVAATNARLLGITAKSRRFKPLRYRIEEREALPDAVHVADRVVLVPFPHRVVALAATSAAWSQLSLGSREQLRTVVADANLGAVVTDRRAVAFSHASGGFVGVALSPKEYIESLSLEESSVTLVTSRRVLIFRAGAPLWTDLLRRNQF